MPINAASGPPATAPPRRTGEKDGGLAQAVFLGMLLLLVWAPLPLASNRPWSWSLLSLIVGMLLAMWAVALLCRPYLLRLSWKRCALTGLLFAAAMVWALLQTLGATPEVWHDPLWATAATALDRPLNGTVSADPAASRGGMMRLIAYAGVFWLAMQYGRHDVYARRVVWCVALVGGAYAIYGIAVYAAGNGTVLWYDRWAYAGDLTSTFVSRAAFGAFAGLGLLSSLALLFMIANRNGADAATGRAAIIRFFDAMPPAFYGMVAVCMTLATALVLTHSRGAVAVTALGIGVMLATLFIRHRNGRRGILFTALIIFAVGLSVLQVSGKVTLGRALQLAEQGTGREKIHSLTWRAIDAAPLTGHGLDTFRHRYFQFRDMSIPWHSPRYDKAHSTYLELAMEMGVVGAGFFLAAIAAITVTIVAGVARRRRNVIYPILGLAATGLIGTHSLLDFGVQMPAVAITYAALLGVAFAQSWRTDKAAG